MKTVYVEVYGSAGSGKQLVQNIIAKALRAHGVEVLASQAVDTTDEQIQKQGARLAKLSIVNLHEKVLL